MRKLTLKMTLLGICLLSWLAILEITVRKVDVPYHDLKYQHQSFIKKRDKVKWIFFGTSMTSEGVNPYYLSQPSFNLAHTSQDLYYDYRVFGKYLPHIPNLEIALFELHFYSLGFDLGTHPDEGALLIREYYEQLGIYPRRENIWKLILFLSRFYEHRSEFLEGLFSDTTSNRKDRPLRMDYHPSFEQKDDLREGFLSNGYFLRQTTMPYTDFQNDVSRFLEFDMALYDKGLVKSRVQLLEKIITLAQRNKVKIVFYTPPVTHVFKMTLKQNYPQELAYFDHVMADLKSRFPDIAFFDFTGLPFKYHLFNNANHLNVHGVKLFSQTLNSHISHHIRRN